MLAKVLLATLLTTSTALAVSPWDDTTIKVDAAAELEVLKELYESRKGTLARNYNLYINGLTRTDDMLQSAAGYFVAASRLACAERKCETSYRYAQLAVISGERAKAAINHAVSQGLVSIDVLMEAQARVAHAKIVVLRFEALAKQRCVALKPLQPMENDEFMELLGEELGVPAPSRKDQRKRRDKPAWSKE
ncbi:hypothetical protein NG895_17090 [Aeoliella sp. ICT_H6.2]|uniref:Uncharacterized protein n=1 Tax=Aeoliella straminimaris TaxID=2954799 RepID=A0A9X2FB41_9BACT|nr:hypothetical protein [Aeoliella straminimaris]MCO6045615.1 hypothetical protein [Aeoliella straminimaris]